MATHQAIAAVSLSLKGLLDRALPKTEFPEAKIELLQAADFAAGSDGSAAMAEGISLLLYRVGINSVQRNLPPRITPDGSRFRPPLPVDLHYLLSAWSDDADIQQNLLGWAMRLFEDTPSLPGSLINSFVPAASPPPPLPPRPVFRPDESIELICDPLPFEHWMSLLEKFSPALCASMTYVVRQVQIDSGTLMPDAERVRQRSFDLAKGPAP